MGILMLSICCVKKMSTLMNQRNLIKRSIIVLIISLCYVFPLKFTSGRKFAQRKRILETAYKGTVKTIESENGDVVDCVDIYMQPALDHPLLKNHTIQLWPSNQNEDESVITQEWNKNGENCPKGSIPIVRSPKLDYPQKVPFVMPHASTRDLNSRSLAFSDGHEYAIGSSSGKNYGASALVNVWNPSTFDVELSMSQMWIIAGEGADRNTIEVGWIVNQGGLKATRIFVFWTRDNYGETGCYNLNCPGFVQVSSKVAIGSEVKPVSIYDGQQYDIPIIVSKEGNNGDWWLEIGGERIGYWPRAILTALADVADSVQWGGEILDQNKESRHTSTQMGSGHFPKEGFKKASYFRNIRSRDASDGVFKDPVRFTTFATKPSCYDIISGRDSKSGVFFFYGGPGYSDTCQN